MEKFLGLTRQCTYLQFEKPSGIGIKMPIHERLAIDLLKGMAKRTSPSPDRVKGLKICEPFWSKKISLLTGEQ